MNRDRERQSEYQMGRRITSVSGYAQQEELFVGTLTVREYLSIQVHSLSPSPSFYNEYTKGSSSSMWIRRKKGKKSIHCTQTTRFIEVSTYKDWSNGSQEGNIWLVPSPLSLDSFLP